MKKLYRRGTVHPSPPIVSDHLSFLPATILALAAALSLEDREVLAYLISYSNSNNNSSVNLSSAPSNGPRKTTTANNSSSRKSTAAKSGSGSGGDHPARFNCNCFRCYTSYWVRWDESPNRELIHEIIDAFEDGLLAQSGSGSSKATGSKYSKKDRRNNNKRGNNGNGSGQGSDLSLKKKDQLVKPHMVEETNSSSSTESGDVDDGEENKGSVRRFVSFLGERIWGTVWSQ